MNENTAVELAQPEDPVLRIRQHADTIRRAISDAMKPDVDYGIIPGVNKPSLLKAGAEKLCMLFRFAVEPEIVSETRTEDEIRFTVKTRITDMGSGSFVGMGVGECSTAEDKYAWRDAVTEAEWDFTPEDRRRLKFTRKGTRKQVKTNPADNANTALKMAKKRSLIDAMLTCTAASDIFTQDMEETVPQKPQEGASEPQDATSRIQGDTWSGVLVKAAVKTGDSKNGKPWVKHVFTGDDGVEFGIFENARSLNVIDIANDAIKKKDKVKVTFSESKWGLDMVDIEFPARDVEIVTLRPAGRSEASMDEDFKRAVENDNPFNVKRETPAPALSPDPSGKMEAVAPPSATTPGPVTPDQYEELLAVCQAPWSGNAGLTTVRHGFGFVFRVENFPKDLRERFGITRRYLKPAEVNTAEMADAFLRFLADKKARAEA